MCEQETETDYSDRISKLEEKIAYLEQKLLLVGDIDRYGPLQEFLVNGKFKEADLETSRLILEISNCKNPDSLTPDNISKFPCNALKIIDRLWRIYSQDRFGYSIQTNIYCQVGGSEETLKTQNIQVFQKFGDKVSWRVNNQWQGNNYPQWDFTINAAKGCFPAVSWKSAYGLKMAMYFFTRLFECNINIKATKV